MFWAFIVIEVLYVKVSEVAFGHATVVLIAHNSPLEYKPAVLALPSSAAPSRVHEAVSLAGLEMDEMIGELPAAALSWTQAAISRFPAGTSDVVA
jgi:hypothetical protein